MNEYGNIYKLRPLKTVKIVKNKNIPLTSEKEFTFEVKIDDIDPARSIKKLDRINIAKCFGVNNLLEFGKADNYVEFTVFLNENGKGVTHDDLALCQKGVISLYEQTYTFDCILEIVDNSFKHVIFDIASPFQSVPRNYDFIWHAMNDHILAESKPADTKNVTDFYVKDNEQTGRKEIYWDEVLLYTVHKDYEYTVSHILNALQHRYNVSNFYAPLKIAKASKKAIRQAAKWLVNKIESM